MMNHKTCRQCKSQFLPFNKRGPTAKFCSNACRQKHYRATTKLVTSRERSGAKREKLVTDHRRSDINDLLQWNVDYWIEQERENRAEGYHALADVYQKLISTTKN